jgi:long-chain acyl-CoA synthetase
VATPLYHLMGNAVAMTTFGVGGSVYILPRFEPEALLALIEREKITHLGMVPTLFVRLLKLPEATRRKYDLGSLRYVAHSAGPCAPEVKRAMIDWLGPIIYEGYGSTETGVVTRVSSEEWLQRPGTVGRPMLTGEIRIYGEDGRALPPRAVGDVYLRMHGTPDFTYQGNPEARARMERDGLLTVGDMGWLDADGYLYICDRRIDMVISGGVNIYPAEIEAALLAHPHIADAVVFGIPDTEMGETLAGLVVLLQGAALDVAALTEWLRPRLAGYKIPRRLRFVPSLPREENGKINKRVIRARYLDELREPS